MFTNFQGKKMPKEKAACKCLLIIMLHSVIKAYEKHHPQIFLEECRYVQEKIKIKNYIDEELKSESDTDSDSDSDSDVYIYIDNEEIR